MCGGGEGVAAPRANLVRVVDHPIRLDRVELAVRPWRTATLVVAAIAAVELVLLVMIGGALLAKPEPAARKAEPKAAASTKAAKATRSTTAITSSFFIDPPPTVVGMRPVRTATLRNPSDFLRFL